jgi:hypothetical protein
MMIPTTLTSPHPHPALRAIFFRWAKGLKIGLSGATYL